MECIVYKVFGEVNSNPKKASALLYGANPITLILILVLNHVIATRGVWGCKFFLFDFLYGYPIVHYEHP